MQDWNPALYLRFANERTRPAAELLARVPSSLHSPARSLHIVDLGCGPGNSTELLVERFPGADVLGVRVLNPFGPEGLNDQARALIAS